MKAVYIRMNNLTLNVFDTMNFEEQKRYMEISMYCLASGYIIPHLDPVVFNIMGKELDKFKETLNGETLEAALWRKSIDTRTKAIERANKMHSEFLSLCKSSIDHKVQPLLPVECIKFPADSDINKNKKDSNVVFESSVYLSVSENPSLSFDNKKQETAVEVLSVTDDNTTVNTVKVLVNKSFKENYNFTIWDRVSVDTEKNPIGFIVHSTPQDMHLLVSIKLYDEYNGKPIRKGCKIMCMK